MNLDEEDFEIVYKEMDQYQPLEELVLPRKNLIMNLYKYFLQGT